MRLLEASAFAAERTRGLVDPTVLGAVRAAGYRRSRVGERPAPLDQALAGAPPRRPARPRPDARWCKLVLDRAAGTVTRPPGVGIDSGGIGKGLAADLCAAQLGPYSSYAVDCGGDLRIGGAGTAPRRVTVDDPFGRGREIGLDLERGAVATSGIAGRVWERDDGFAHHLIDPSRGVPAWTGVVQATALAPTAVEAEALAKAAVLSGPEAGRHWLRRWGGVILARGWRARARRRAGDGGVRMNGGAGRRTRPSTSSGSRAARSAQWRCC